MNATPTKLHNWNELLTAVESNQGVHKVTMETLRELEGRQRVGKHIISDIEEKLSTLGIGHLPQVLPNRQQQIVLLYRHGTPVSEVIRAVQVGLTEPVTDSAYRILHRLNSLPDPATVVAKADITDSVQVALRGVMDLLRQVDPAQTPDLDRVPESKVDLQELMKSLVPLETYSNR